MKKYVAAALALALLMCAFALAEVSFDAGQDALERLKDGNAAFVSSGTGGDISSERRIDTAVNGQHPYAVVITCSDSRVPAEHIFSAGVGDLFVIRTAGNVIGTYELGSVEYGAEHLHAGLVVVLGHTQCGAVDAALNGGAHGNIARITDEISAALPEGCDPREAERLNVENSLARIMESEIMRSLCASGEVQLVGAIYDIASGEVEFMD